MTVFFFSCYVIYLGVLLGALILTVWWLRRRRRSKLPFDEKIERVSRTPGESARQKVEQLSDQLMEDLLVAFGTPLVVAFVFAIGISLARPTGLMAHVFVYGMGATCLVILGVLVWRMSRRILERSDWHLGQYGERNVADKLEPLKQRGWRIFHDVPAERKGRKFNIDHVAVGPGGVFAIETKTPRRPEMGSGRGEHIVEYDGTRLRWPTGRIDDQKSQMAQARADWVKSWLAGEGIRVAEVVPVLAIPWWYVKPVGEPGYVQAVNPGQLGAIIGNRTGVLTDEQVKAIADKLETRCRNVEL